MPAARSSACRTVLAALAATATITACAPLLPSPLPDVLILGEQHDAPEHQRLHGEVVRALARRGELAGLALEMATAPHSTAGLPKNASAAQVRSALGWVEPSWPWSAYEPAVMTAVRAGVPVVGADLPRASLREAMSDATLDQVAGTETLQAQVENVREGHCGLLAPSQGLPLARAQIARDQSLAQGVARLVAPNKTAVLITGAQHADARLGVPRYLPRSLRSVSRLWPRPPPAADYCEQLKKQVGSQVFPGSHSPAEQPKPAPGGR